MLCPRRCRACRSQTRNTVRSRHTDEYQRQGPQTDDIEKQLGRKIHSFFQHQEWIKPVSKYEEAKTLNYNLREDDPQSTNSRRDRNNEKGPGSNYGPARSGTYVYHTRVKLKPVLNYNLRRDNQKSTKGDRNYEKGSRTDYTRSGADEYQRRASNGNVGRHNQQRTKGDRNYAEKGPRIGYTRSVTDAYQRRDRLQRIASTTKYEGCKDKGLYCRYWKYIGCCDQPLGRRLCSRTCGFCLPMNPVCPRSSKFGCCWDGVPARDPEKKSCKTCRDKSKGICSRQAVYRECDLYSANTMETRGLCPQTCGACYDYSTYA